MKKITSVVKSTLLFCFITLVAMHNANAQATQPPNISYNTTYKVLPVNQPMQPLSLDNSGGSIPSNYYLSVKTLAGTGVSGFKDSIAQYAQFNQVMGITQDNLGNVYVAENGASRIRKISKAGVVTTFAGNGSFGSTDNAVATSATFGYPSGIVYQASTGKIYVSDYGTRKIRVINPDGSVTTFAGSGGYDTTNNSNGLLATFKEPYAMAFDGNGNLYVADQGANNIRKITPGGSVSVFAGSGVKSSLDGTGTQATFNAPRGLVFDTLGNLYVSEAGGQKIRKVSPMGVVTTLAGTGNIGSNDNVNGLLAGFYQPSGLTIDINGNIYVADNNSFKVRKITPSGAVSTIAGSGSFASNSGIGTAASFKAPFGITIDNTKSSYLIMTELFGYKIDTISLGGYTISGVLPTGLVFDSTSGTISGTPTQVTNSGVYTITAYNATGNSSTTIRFSICAPTSSNNNISICSNQLPYQWNGVNYTSSGTYTKTGLTNAAGCDSTATLVLTVNQPTSSSSSLNISSNQLPYSWNGLTFTTAGTQTAHLTNAAGCDSAATLTLSIAVPACNPSSSTTNVTVCASALPYVWNGNSYTAAGSYIIHLTNAGGCDSAATLNLTVTANASAGQILSNTNGIITSLTICTLGSPVSVYPQTTGGTWSSRNPSVATGVKQSGATSSGFVTGLATGTAAIVYTLPNLINGCNPITVIPVTVAPQTSPSAVVGNATTCVGLPSTYSSSPTGGVWSAPRGTFAGNVYTPNSAGNVIVTYKLTNAAGCSASVSKNITNNTVPATPSINFAAGTIGITGSGGYCTNRTFTLVGVPAGGTWSKTGAIASITSGGVVTTTSVTGAASAIYTVTANGCSSSRSTIGNIVACSPRGVNSLQSTDDNKLWTIYPNPAHNVINLKVDKLIGAGSIVVTDLYGKQIKQQPLSMGSNTIDVSSFAKGMYLVSIITESGKQTSKIVVE